MTREPLVWTQSGDDYNNVVTVTRNGKVVARFTESYGWTTIVIPVRPVRLEFGRGGRRQRKRRRAQKLRLR